MFSYITPRDVNGSAEGHDDEADGMGTLFEYPMDDPDTFNEQPDRPFPFDGVGQIIMNEQLEQLTLPKMRKLAVESDVADDMSGVVETIKENKVAAGIGAAAILGGLYWLFLRRS